MAWWFWEAEYCVRRIFLSDREELLGSLENANKSVVCSLQVASGAEIIYCRRQPHGYRKLVPAEERDRERETNNGPAYHDDNVCCH